MGRCRSYERRVSNGETRNRLIEEATRAFLAEGYGAASLDRIAKAAQISKKTIYRFVDSKADLFVAVVRNALDAIPVGALVGTYEDEDPEATLRDFLTGAAALGLSEEGLSFHWMIIREAGNFPELVEAFRQAVGGFALALSSWMKHQSERGWLSIASPEQAASTLLTLLLEETRRGFALGLRGAPDADEQARIVDYTLDLFLYGTRRQQG
jgi:AcrR family transcriptional regulator